MNRKEFLAVSKSTIKEFTKEDIPSFIVTRLLSFAIMLALAGLLVASVVVSTMLTTTRSVTQEVLGRVPGDQIFWQVVTIGVSFLTVFVGFLLMYRFLPRYEEV